MTLYTTVQLNYSRMPPSHSMHHRRNLYNFYIRFKNGMRILKGFVIGNRGGTKSENGGEEI